MSSKTKEKEPEAKKRKEPEGLSTRTGGAYIPPAKLRMMQKNIEDKSSAEYQRLAWEQLKKSINGLINKVNTSNITTIVRELIKQNLIRGRGLLCRSIMQAQAASQTFTNVYAALVSIINSKFPNIGELLLKRLIIQFRRSYRRNDKPNCLSAAKFIAHLVNQQVAHEVLALELLTLLLEHPTEDSVEVAIAFLKEVGARLEEVSPRGAHAIFERLRHVLHEGNLEKRVQYMIEVMFQVRKDKFKDFPTLPEELDLVEEEDQFTHLLTLDEVTEGQDILNVFKVDEDFVENEDKYATLRKEILDESEEEGSGEEGEDEDEDEDEDEEAEGKETILDKTETNMLALRRTIYLTIQSSLDFEECCHKILKLNLKEGQEVELCHMILDCCAQQRTYEKFFGLLAQRFCNLPMGRKYVEPFQQIFKDTYDTVHRLDTNKLRNVAKFFAHLLYTDAISWEVLQHIHLTEDETTSSSRIFIKILIQELSEFMGLQKLNQRLQDPTLTHHFEGLFPRDHPKNTRFSINFFTSIGLGGLTDELREFLKKQPKPTAIIAPQRNESPEAKGSGSSSGSSSSDSSDSESSSSTSSSSDSDSSSSDSSSGSSSSSSSSSSDSSSDESDGGKGKRTKRSSKKKSEKEAKTSKKHKDRKSSKSRKSTSPRKLLDKLIKKEKDESTKDSKKVRSKDSSRDRLEKAKPHSPEHHREPQAEYSGSRSREGRRPRTPPEVRRSRSPRENRRSRTPREGRRPRTPPEVRRSRSPRENRRSRTPREGRRSKSPRESRRIAPMREEPAEGRRDRRVDRRSGSEERRDADVRIALGRLAYGDDRLDNRDERRRDRDRSRSAERAPKPIQWSMRKRSRSADRRDPRDERGARPRSTSRERVAIGRPVVNEEDDEGRGRNKDRDSRRERSPSLPKEKERSHKKKKRSRSGSKSRDERRRVQEDDNSRRDRDRRRDRSESYDREVVDDEDVRRRSEDRYEPPRGYWDLVDDEIRVSDKRDRHHRSPTPDERREVLDRSSRKESESPDKRSKRKRKHSDDEPKPREKYDDRKGHSRSRSVEKNKKKKSRKSSEERSRSRKRRSVSVDRDDSYRSSRRK